MERLTFEPRENWTERCEKQGFRFHSIGGEPYWRETAGYRFSLKEIDCIETATAELHTMCMDLVADVVKSGNYDSYHLPNWVPALIERSWNAKEPYLYGRFDFVYAGGEIKLLEYNADTPTSLLEASVIQWTWIEDRDLPDQFNSIHEKLVARWKHMAKEFPLVSHVYLTTMSDAGLEDWSNVSYLAETVVQAELDCSLINLEEVGWDNERRFFVDVNDKPIIICFKLYPWEWMVYDEFGKNIAYSNTRFIEPAWKMLLSSKAILPLLWERHKGHPLLLPAYFESGNSIEVTRGKWVRKPILAREGANVSLFDNGEKKNLLGSDYNPAYDEGYVLQQWRALPDFDGWHPVIGSWVIGDDPAGMGIREDKGFVTGNESYFVSHYFDEEN